jgi:hypothetical protein
MKKLLMACMMLVAMQASAQKVDDFGIFQHFGANLGVGTEGISIGVAAPVTNYLEVGFGINFMVAIKPSGDVNINNTTAANDVPRTNASGDYLDANGNVVPNATTDPTQWEKVAKRSFPLNQLNIKGNTARTTFDFKVSAYPFGLKNDFFVTAGFSFGGKKIATLEGHSDDVAAIYQWSPRYEKDITAVVDKYDIKIDHQGNVDGDIRVNAFRPYLGLGYGRLVPKGRVGFRAELGLQFMGHMKVYQNDTELDVKGSLKGNDDLSKIIDKWAVYPVLKFMLTTRIL